MSEFSADRPSMPNSYGVKGPEEGRGLLPWRHAETLLESARNYWVITASAHGVPHAAPVWGLWYAQAFHFSTDPQSSKGRYLATSCPVVVHLESGDEVVILEGNPDKVVHRAGLKKLEGPYFKKYRFHPSVGVTFRVRPFKVMAWSEADFPGGATRWTPRAGRRVGEP